LGVESEAYPKMDLTFSDYGAVTVAAGVPMVMVIDATSTDIFGAVGVGTPGNLEQRFFFNTPGSVVRGDVLGLCIDSKILSAYVSFL
jgi:hypothetical protein